VVGKLVDVKTKVEIEHSSDLKRVNGMSDGGRGRRGGENRSRLALVEEKR
jgi:hypothetical protein